MADMSRIAHLGLAERLAYFAECQLATVEDLEDRRRPPKRELERHRSIPAQMVETCRQFSVQIPTQFSGPRFPRLAKLLSPSIKE